MGGPHEARETRPRIDIDGGHEIESQQRQISKIILSQFLTAEVRMETPQSTETLLRQSPAILCREYDPRSVTDDDVFDVTSPVYENSNLTSDLGGEFREVSCEFRRDDFSWRETALIDLLEPSDLIWL